MCTSPLVRFRLKRGVKSDSIFTNSTSFSIKSQKELEKIFGSYSAFRLYFDSNCDYQFIKCRKCIECRADYAQQWSIRCCHEFQMSKIGSFLTLTIDSAKANLFLSEKNLKHYCKRCVNGNRFIKYPVDYTLCKGLILDELKRIRDNIYKKFGIKVRYFGCGEYGSDLNSNRPHYHLLLFGFNFPDKKFIGVSNKGFNIYHSEYLQSMWKYGLCTVQDVDYNVCRYVAKYVMKKIKSNDDIVMQEQYYGREPEFLFMSKGSCNAKRCIYIDDIIKNCKGLTSLRSLKNPYCKNCKYTRGGIGFSWLSHYFEDMLKIGYVTIDGMKFPIPKYYIDILKLTDFEIYDKYKINILHRIDENSEKLHNEGSLDRLCVKNKILIAKLKAYHRE